MWRRPSPNPPERSSKGPGGEGSHFGRGSERSLSPPGEGQGVCQRATPNGKVRTAARPRYARAVQHATEATMKTGTATRGDFETLTALNDDYIASVQHGDVRRFDQILAEDFLCSNPDGSLVDKRQFLEQTARPVTITGLAASDVRVRFLGKDVAVIHGRTSYATASGETRNGRYTDVWARRNGQWLAVSAHVTR